MLALPPFHPTFLNWLGPEDSPSVAEAHIAVANIWLQQKSTLKLIFAEGQLPTRGSMTVSQRGLTAVARLWACTAAAVSHTMRPQHVYHLEIVLTVEDRVVDWERGP